jgi:Vacuolar protein sorting-associated protein 62
MRFLSRLIVVLLVCGPVFHVQAANEWKNPDQVTPEKKPAAHVHTPAPVPAPTPGPTLKGQLSLEVKRICDYQLSYIDKGSGGKIDGSFYLPNIPNGYSMIGGYAQGNYHDPSDCVLAVKPVNPQSVSLLQAPQDWKRLWKDKGSGANMDGSIWHPSPPSNDYVCLGSIAREGYKQPALTNYACVHRCLVESIPVASPVWSTKGTGAKQKAYIYKLHISNSFFTATDNNHPRDLQDLKGNTSCAFND